MHGMAFSRFAPFLLLSLALSACSGNSEGKAPPLDTGAGNGMTVEGEMNAAGGLDSGSGSDPDSTDSTDGTEVGSGGTGELVDSATESPDPDYPEGPYGEQNPEVGDTIEDLLFEGYKRIEAGAVVGDGSIAEIRLSDLRASGATYLFIHTATTWCPSCRAAADDLGLEADSFDEQDVQFLELLLDGSTSGITPDDTQLSNWAKGSDLTVSTVREIEGGRVRAVFPSREYVYIIDLASMQVVWRKQALFSSPTITEEGLSGLRDLL